MSIDSLLITIENFRSTIENWGLSTEALWLAGAVAFVVFLFSLREVLSWFLKIQSLAEDLRVLRGEVRDLKKYMEVAREVNEIVVKTQEEGLINPSQPASLQAEALAKRFPFDH